jgi:hypothetical protein
LRRAVTIRLLAPVAAVIPLLATCKADIIDRIAVSVGTKVITTSDIDREIRVTAFLNGIKPDLSAPNRKATAERLVEQKLIQREVETSRYPQADPAEAAPVLSGLKLQRFPEAGQFQAALAEYGIAEKDLLDEIRWQRTLLRFVEIRFRPGVQVSDEEIQKYFDQNVAPAARTAHPNETPQLDDYRDQIEEKLLGDRTDEEMNRWLTGVRRRTEIVFHEDALQ